MKTIKLNPAWRASEIDGKVYAHTRIWTSEGDICVCGMLLSKADVLRVMRLKRPSVVYLPPPGETRKAWNYDFIRKPKYVQIGCQRFYLTRLARLLALFK